MHGIGRQIMMLGLGLLWLSAVVAEEKGALLYGQHCAVCHGDHGEGGVGIPLTLPSFQSSVDDRYLRETIKLGRPGRVMPAFDMLDELQIQAIVDYLRSWHESPRPKFSYVPINGDKAHGKTLYATHCAACHGENGEGGKGTGVTLSRKRDLPIIPPALNNSGFLASSSDAMIRATLEKGRAGTPMVSFREQGLSDSDLDDLVTYIRSFEAGIEPVQRLEEMDSALVYESPYSLEETIANVERAAQGMNFRLIRKQPLEEGFFPETEVNQRQVIVYFCNFEFLYEALKLDPRVGLFLPCRVTVVEDEAGVKVYAVNPKRLSVLFNNNALDEACDKMTKMYQDILEEATL